MNNSSYAGVAHHVGVRVHPKELSAAQKGCLTLCKQPLASKGTQSNMVLQAEHTEGKKKGNGTT